MARQSLFPILMLSLALGVAACSGGLSSSGGGSAPSPPPEDPIVASYDDTSLTRSAFEQAYVEENQRSNPAGDSLEAYENFLDQYVNFRLKVLAAREAGMDTLSNLQREVASYRQKMARPILMQSEVYGPITRTLHERRKQEVDVSHILIRMSPEAPPEDTLEAYQEIQAIEDSLAQGVPFPKLAFRNSDDPSARKKGNRGYRGRLGYVRAGELVPPFEDRMYSVPPDSVSDIFRTRFGYHIIKVHDRRPTKPPVRLSHIMLRRSRDAEQASDVLDSLRTEVLENRTPFDSLARKYSEDQQSAQKGGDLGVVDSRESLPPSFRDGLASIDSIGGVSEVVETKFGYHLIQLTDRQSLPSYKEAYDDLKELISDDPRVERRKVKFARQVRTEAGTAVDTSRLLGRSGVSSVDTLSRALLPILDQDSNAEAPVATLGDSTYTLAQLARHVMQTDGGAQQSIREATESFLNEKAFQYASARLEKRDSTFAAQMREYREGLLVFQFMQDSVWTVASQDTAALRKTYQERREEYRYPDRVRTLALRAPADSLLTPYEEAYADTKALSPLVQRAASDSLVTLDTVMVTKQSPEIYQQMLTENDGSAVGPTDDDGESLYLVRDTVVPARPKSFEEARSRVLQDYRREYEEQVLDRLRRRYNVKTYPDRLQKAFTDPADTDASRP